MHWLINTRQGFATRLSLGVTFFLVLAIVDLIKHGRGARRWREYLFLIFCVAAAVIYGIVNDQITSRISWEYFYFGKQLEAVLGPQIPPDALKLSIEAAKIGMMATWSVGLLLGVALLIANNPRTNSPPPLAFSRLCLLLVPILAIAISFAVLFGFLGWAGYLDRCSTDFIEMRRTNYFRPSHFIATFGVHLGGYVGGLVGGTWGVFYVLRARSRRK